ncbi:DUF2807 domain-containing protein [Paracrocinitomix mangrovi]|uniref:head GIN domain-containing protein n=1 Tax=Paracrocinitomix mangrovi TaxID=2862509 RepID=UPI001C8CFE6F|nr:head GIN domain-containing protein [Paracrocinitomix mangrovi]UKN01075.1 DUF2807 domain-containing protein [Paracrocinitomix mangrovi]
MKRMKFFIPVLSVLALASCKKGGVFCYHGNGDIITETRTVNNFSQIELASQGTVYVTQSSDYNVKVEASSNLMEILETKVVGSKLIIETKKGKCIKGNEEINYYISAPEISALIISGSGNILAEDGINANNMKFTISGSGDITANNLDVNDVKATISGSGSIYAHSTNTVETSDLTISGSGNIDMYEMPTKDVDCNISGSGSCYVNAIETLKVNISGSGDVVYIGQPVLNTNISGSGNVRPY